MEILIQQVFSNDTSIPSVMTKEKVVEMSLGTHSDDCSMIATSIPKLERSTHSESMMDISSNGSTENMEQLILSDTDDSQHDDEEDEDLVLHSGVYGVGKNCLVFPDSVDLECNTLGEDAYFVCDHAVGVFDGVGGWKSNGVDPSEYSGTLARECQCVSTMNNHPNYDPQDIIRIAYHNVEREEQVIGSSTACIACLEPVEPSKECESGYILNTALVGDSGYLIIRRNNDTGRCSVLFKSHEQQHYFNAPFQLALVHGRFAHLRNTIFNDKPNDAVTARHVVQRGDVIVSGSDGLLDNLFDFEILKIVDAMYYCDPSDIAKEIARKSFDRSFSDEETPFERNARNSGQYFKGGKRDDVSVIVSRVAGYITESD